MLTSKTLAAALTGSALLAAVPAFAHHPGSPGNTGGSGPINTISATTLPQGMTVVSVIYETISLDPLSDETLAHSAEHAHEEGHGHVHVHSLQSIVSPSLNIAYGLTSDMTVSLRLPYVVRTDIREGHFDEAEHEGEVEVHGDSRGIGDLSTLLQWRFFEGKATGTEAALLAGIKAPTGDTSEDDDGERLDAEFQPGSGSWDGMIGLALTQRVKRWSFDGSMLYIIAGEGTQNTDLGDRLHYGLAVSYRLTTFQGGGAMFNGAGSHQHGSSAHHATHSETGGLALDLVLELNGEWQDKQESDGEVDENSGGHALYVSPGLRLAQDTWSAFASVGIPVVNELNGLQAESDWRLTTGVSLGF